VTATLRNDQSPDKTLTIPEILDIGFFRAIDAILKKASIEPNAVSDVLVHARPRNDRRGRARGTADGAACNRRLS
jgi:hypothetical protein